MSMILGKRFTLVFAAFNCLTVPLLAAPNHAPVANNDSFTINEDTVLTVAAPGVLGNDTDPDQDVLTAIRVSNPSHGTLTLNSDGSFTYTPVANFNGADSFAYKANDGRADSGVATVTITINPVNDRPLAVNDPYTVNEDRVLTVPAPGVLANDRDIDGDALVASSSATSTILNPGHGTVTMQADGSFVYTPDANFNGTDSFVYLVGDSHGAFNIGGVSITVLPVNDRPVAQNLSITTAANTAITITLVGTDVETSSGSLIFDAPVSGPSHGAAAFPFFAPNAVRYTPNSGFAGDDSFTYTVSDGVLTSRAATVTIHVVPELSIRNQSINEGARFLLCLGHQEITLVPVVIDLSVPNPTAVTVQLRLIEGTALSESAASLDDTDYICNGCDNQVVTLTIPPNTSVFQLTENIYPVLVLGDCSCEPDETFSMRLGSPVNALIKRGTATVTILNDDLCFGTAELIPSEAAVRVGEHLTYSLTWTHPERWRLLETIDLRISDGEGTIFYVHWNEPANTFSLFNPASGEAGPEAAPGNRRRLETSAATMYLAESSVVGTGPTGPSVTLNFDLSFKPQAGGRTYRVEVFATDDFGHQQGFEPVGILTVLPR